MLQATGTVTAAGWVSVVDTGLSLVPSDVMLRLAALALDQSRSNGTARIERTLIATEPTCALASVVAPPTGP